ncbi:MAG: flagellar biosynthesis anti-sigma factor FlgM [Desulfovibrionaceae bacterium]|nr:flagellar biosynthesis anti-sigma factor FlgM [Desulfovibrionaceae bacterium]
MDINELFGTGKAYGQNRVGSGQTGQVAGSGRDAKSARTTGASDTVTLSGNAKLFSQAVRDAQNAPEVRVERVAELKAQVESGEYQPDSHKIAEKMLLAEIDLLS